MTTAGVNSADIFTDARRMHESALERLAADDIRDAAEKAWCATLRATDALILARTGELPPISPVTTRELRRMAMTDPIVEDLLNRYRARQSGLHGECFYAGMCEPIEDTVDLIRKTSEYVRDAERLAEG